MIEMSKTRRRWIYVVMLVGGMIWGVHLIYTSVMVNAP